MKQRSEAEEQLRQAYALGGEALFEDEYAIYIGAKLYDSCPQMIVQKFVNRDDFVKLSMSDWFRIWIESHHDHQTAYEFIVNAAGIQFDSFLFDDTGLFLMNTVYNVLLKRTIDKLFFL